MNQLISRPPRCSRARAGRGARAELRARQVSRRGAGRSWGFEGGSAGGGGGSARRRPAGASACLPVEVPRTRWLGPAPTLRVPAPLPSVVGLCGVPSRPPSSRLHPRCFPPIRSGGLLEWPTVGAELAGKPARTLPSVQGGFAPQDAKSRRKADGAGSGGGLGGVKQRLWKIRRTLMLVTGSLAKCYQMIHQRRG